MTTELIRDRGRGPEIVDTRVTVYNLLPHFLDPTATEAYIGRLYDLTPEEVAAARAYVLNNPDTVLAGHLKIEARMAAGNPPAVAEQAERTHATLLKFREWLEARDRADAGAPSAEVGADPGDAGNGRFPTFREWLAERESRPVEGP
jgi:uncharacterized protein (DUF433 family)